MLNIKMNKVDVKCILILVEHMNRSHLDSHYGDQQEHWEVLHALQGFQLADFNSGLLLLAGGNLCTIWTQCFRKHYVIRGIAMETQWDITGGLMKWDEIQNNVNTAGPSWS